MSVPVGTTMESPATRQAMTFATTASASGGTVLRVEARIDPGGFVPPHRHLSQTERFEVLEGRARFLLGRRRILAGPGASVTVPPHTVHALRNAGDAPLRLTAALRPALDAEDVFAALLGWGAAGEVNRLGAPSPLRAAALLRDHPESFFYLPGLPPALQRAFAAALLAVARRSEAPAP